MLSLPHTYDARVALREEASDYLIQRIQEPWMHDLMVLCEELNGEDVSLIRFENLCSVGLLTRS